MADKEKELLCNIWRRAAGSQTPLTIPCGTRAEATRVRFALYNAVKWAKQPGAQVDAVLAEAVEGCGLRLTEDKTGVIVYRKGDSPMMQTLAAVLNAPEQAPAPSIPASRSRAAPPAASPPEDTEARLAREAQRRMLDKYADPSPAQRSTPYYKR